MTSILLTRKTRIASLIIMTLSVLASSVATTLAVEPDAGAFSRVWSRTDLPVQEGQAQRTWLWGPGALSEAFAENYAEAPGGQRMVQYYDKARMEITNPNGDAGSIWYVTNGLLVVELVTGQMQTGDASFTMLSPARINVAGDADDPDGPTYASFAQVLDQTPLAVGETVIQRIDRAGELSDDSSLASQGVTVALIDDVTNHSIAAPFWEFMSSEGLVYADAQYVTAALFDNPYFATGRPIAEPAWARVLVAGEQRDVLIQCFERRCLTYTPDNPAGWQVESGNVGRHYYQWRYRKTTSAGDEVEQGPVLSLPTLEDGASLELPVSISYEISGDVGLLAGDVHLHVIMDDPATGYALEIALENLTGTFVLPDDKALPGERNLTFQIVDSRHVPFMNPGASVTIHDLQIVGRRVQASANIAR